MPYYNPASFAPQVHRRARRCLTRGFTQKSRIPRALRLKLCAAACRRAARNSNPTKETP